MMTLQKRWLPPLTFALLAGALQAAPTDDLPLEEDIPAFKFNSEPVRPVPLEIELDPRKRDLGRKLFFNPSLSADQQTSCASCHKLPKIQEGIEVNGASEPMGKRKRSVALLYNTTQALWLNWDGRYNRIEALLEDAFPDLDKMNLDWKAALPRIAAAHGAEFQGLYGDSLNKSQVVEVLAAFLRSLSTPNARFDRFLRGDPGALNHREKQGYDLFKRIGCTSCHNGVLLGANFFEQFYVYRDESSAEGEPRLKDKGRYYFTAEEGDRNVFRVPSLRNVALSAPYFHDGSADTLHDAVEEMIEHQLGLEPEEEQIELLVDFLQTLTGNHEGAQP